LTKLKNFSKKRTNLYFSTLLLLVVSIILTLLPLPNMLKWIWPQWILLTLIYRVIIRPERYGIFFAFTMGLIVDLLLSNKLGIHALSYAVIGYCLVKMQQRIYLFPVVQQSILIFLLVLLDFVAVITFSTGNLNWVFVGHSVLSSMSTAIMWLFVVLFYGLKQELSKIR
jgi:rod shape-determining protein MreD